MVRRFLTTRAVPVREAGRQSLYFGLPLIAIPLTHDQPAIAARLARTGAGIVIPAKQLSADRLREALRSVLPERSVYREQARRLQQASRAAGGIERAADIAERTAGI